MICLWPPGPDRHCIELLQSLPDPGHLKDTKDQNEDALTRRRPWFQFRYNEGTSISLLNHQYDLHQNAHSLVGSIIEDLGYYRNDVLTSFTYKGISPCPKHFYTIIKALKEHKNLKALTFQFALSPEFNPFSSRVLDHRLEQANQRLCDLALFIWIKSRENSWEIGTQVVIRDALIELQPESVESYFFIIKYRGWASDEKEEVWTYQGPPPTE